MALNGSNPVGAAPYFAARKLPQRAADPSSAVSPLSHLPDAAEAEPRLARPGDIANATAISKGAKRYWINHLCKYRNVCNVAWPKMATAMADLVASERSIQNYRTELLKAGYICLPEGDAGGRPADGASRGLAIHLHPDGKPCKLPHVVLKQRSAQRQIQKGADSAPLVERNPGGKGAELAPLRVQKTTEKGAENDSAIRNELLIEPFIEEPSTTATVPSDVSSVIAPIQRGLDAAAGPPAYETMKAAIFDDLQPMCEPPAVINAVGRQRILRSAAKHGFSLDQLVYAWRHDARAQTGGLITLAERWPEETAHLRFPICSCCEDTGIPLPKQKLVQHPRKTRGAALAGLAEPGSDNPAFCVCSVGVEAAAANARSKIEEGQILDFANRDEERNLEIAKAVERDRLYRQEKQEKAIEEARRLDNLRAQHLCPTCEGKCGREQCGSWHICVDCLGTGKYFTAAEWRTRGECGSCRGTGRILDRKQFYNRTSKRRPRMVPCAACDGSGRTMNDDKVNKYSAQSGSL